MGDYPINSIGGVCIEELGRSQILDFLVRGVDGGVNLRFKLGKRSLRELLTTMKKKLKEEHPIHNVLNEIDVSILRKLNCMMNEKALRTARVRAFVANHYFSNHPNGPLAALKDDVKYGNFSTQEVVRTIINFWDFSKQGKNEISHISFFHRFFYPWRTVIRLTRVGIPEFVSCILGWFSRKNISLIKAYT